MYLAGSAVNWELAANTDTDTTAFDRVVVTASSLVFTGSTSPNLMFNAPGSTVLWSDSCWDIDRSWTIYDLPSGASTPSLVNLVLGGSLLDSQGQSRSAERGSFSLGQVDGNVVLTFAAVPKPSAFALAAVGVAVTVVVRRRTHARRQPRVLNALKAPLALVDQLVQAGCRPRSLACT